MVKAIINLENHHYDNFEKSIKDDFAEIIKNKKQLFKVRISTDLWEAYIDALDPNERQQYKCSCCRSFIRKYGDLVIIDTDGRLKSAIWHPASAPSYFKEAVGNLKLLVEASRVTSVFHSDQRHLGKVMSGGRHHLAVALPESYINQSVWKKANQLMIESQKDFEQLSAALNTYRTESVATIKALILSDVLYRGGRFSDMISWFNQVILHVENETDLEVIRHLTWLYVAEAKSGYCDIKKSVVGALIADYEFGIPIETIIQRYNEKLDPANYMRIRKKPSEEEVIKAEELVGKLGITDSLKRRYAKLEDIPTFMWRSRYSDNGNVFSKIITQSRPFEIPRLRVPIKTMTWKKFKETVLPKATNIEAKVENTSRLMGLVTESISNSKPLFQWNNAFSWYYHGGVDGKIKKGSQSVKISDDSSEKDREIERRIQVAGGKYDDNDIRCSLRWENYTDLDLQCLTPKGKQIDFSRNKVGKGKMDVDMNLMGESEMPVANIRWPKNTAANGSYCFTVVNYDDRSNGSGTFYKVELEVEGYIYHYHGYFPFDDMHEHVFEFNYEKGRPINLIGVYHNLGYSDWNLEIGNFKTVNAIVKSPNLWDGKDAEESGNHTFFLLDGCHDKSKGKSRGFFNEMLRSDFKEINKILEAYTASTPIQGAEDATACGLGFSKESTWDLTLKVTADGLERLILIDRFD
ncbi:hypothetical protein [Brochothrix thermosphacta]|uniref:Uncharacterized protein n=1 Tax=Brochothrix thermosphacta TaxID=2756 RepID=A0A2X0QRD7_BROTH|nr:hypothetical protein [Brochothrix thermosphacta]SPP30753.1 conserved hypothetical protein [Brochothrix thermosphacta]